MIRSLSPAGLLAGLVVLTAGPAQAQGAFLGPSTVTTGGQIYQYEGPLGGAIYDSGSVANVDPATTWFRDRFSLNQAPFAPQYAYGGYDWPQFAGTGTGVVPLFGNVPSGPGGANQFWYATQGVDFWVQYGDSPDPLNSLRMDGHVTQNVRIDTTTGKSGPIKLATFTFTNGTWYGSDPPVQPGGLGQLYPAARFQYSLIVSPDPMIGQSGFAGYHVLNDAVTLTTTFGPNTPDYLSFDSLYGQSSSVLAVDEGATASVELWGRIGSVEPLELRNASEGASILDAVPMAPVPEPALVLQWGLGLALLAGLGRLRRRA